MPVAALVLASCQANFASSPIGAPNYVLTSHQRSIASRAPTFPCSSNPEYIRGKGGKIANPSVPGSGDFSGTYYYAKIASEKFKNVDTHVDSCSSNYYGVPVPQGYTPDWFGAWALCEGSACNSFSFGPGNLEMSLESSTWDLTTSYYMYLYTLKGQQLIESYPIGSPTTKGKNKRILTFSSPYQNGFVYPQNDYVGLEIVHPSQ
jgi:hypothetical protein